MSEPAHDPSSGDQAPDQIKPPTPSEDATDSPITPVPQIEASEQDNDDLSAETDPFGTLGAADFTEILDSGFLATLDGGPGSFRIRTTEEFKRIADDFKQARHQSE